MFTAKPITPTVTGWLEVDLSDQIVEYLKKRIEFASASNRSIKFSLAGHISESLNLEDKDNYFYKNVLLPCANTFIENFPWAYPKKVSSADRTNLYLEKFWVNFQKKHEFNPLHTHSGIYSFVVWIKIPTNSEEQHSLPFLRDQNNPCASDFSISYIDTSGVIRNKYYPMDKSSEGKMLFFPSSLNHCVYPFYESDEERVSISGNLFYGNL